MKNIKIFIDRGKTDIKIINQIQKKQDINFQIIIKFYYRNIMDYIQKKTLLDIMMKQ